MARHSPFVLVPLMLAGCAAYSPPPVPVSGAHTDIAVLAGEWHGEYSSDESSGRSGSILFRLAAGADTARGDVVMLVHPRGRPPGYMTGSSDARARAMPEGQLLSITFVRAETGGVSGLLHPYTDPDCGCTLRTTFTGRIDGDLITGTYTTRHVDSGATTRGRWSVTRRTQ